MAESNSVPTQDVSNVSRLEQAYRREFENLMGLSPADFTTINLDVPTVYMLGTGALIKMRGYREQIRALPGMDLALVDSSEDRLLALGHAQALHLAANPPPASIPELYA